MSRWIDAVFVAVIWMLILVTRLCIGGETWAEKFDRDHAELMRVNEGILTGLGWPVSLQFSNQNVMGESDANLYPCVCEVRRQGAGGSGVLVTSTIAVTAAHVTGGHSGVRLWFPATNESISGDVIREDRTSDLAIVRLIYAAKATPTRIAASDPSPNETVTVAGFGGHPRKGFFAAAGRLFRLNDRSLSVSVPVSHGDSGGPAFNSRGELVGVNSTSDLRSVVNCGGRPRIIRELVETCSGVTQTQCGPGGCGTSGVNRPHPVRPSEWTPAPRTDSTPIQPLTSHVSAEQIATAVIERMASDPRFRGPPGPAGPAGKDGKSPEINYDRLTSEIVRRLPPITFEIQEQGRTVASQATPLGGTVKLDLVPIR